MERVLKRSWLRYFGVLALLLCAAQVTTATTIIGTPADDDMLIGARAVVRGKVLSLSTGIDEQNRIYTYITLKVQEVIKGQITENKIVIKEEGGAYGDRGSIIFGAPQFALGEKVILYLDTRADGSLRVHQMFFGKFSIVKDEQTGKEMAVRQAPDENVHILSPENHDHARGPSTNQMELSAYLAMVRSRLEVNREAALKFEADNYAGIPVLARPVEYEDSRSRGDIKPNFTLIHSAKPRWFEPDTGLPVLFFVNPAGAPNAQILDDVSAAMVPWSTVAGCSLRVVNGGTTGNCLPSSVQNTIVFNNCDGRWAAGSGCQNTLALGGLGWTGETTVINGTTFRRAQQGFISFNPFASCNFANSCNVREITTHELGHALGLGHSEFQDATMAPFAHFDGRCASIRQDDINGILFLYPAGAGSGGPLSIVTSSLTGALVNTPYTGVLIAAGGTAPYTWSLASGSAPLPPGLTLNSNGNISGTPTTAGTYNFTVRVTDSASATATKALSISVVSGSTALDSQFVSQTVPTTVNPGQTFTVNVKWLNTGTETWGAGFRVVSQNPPQNSTWGGNNVPLGGLFNVPQGQELDLSFTVFAPSAAGTYNFQWQMWKDGPGFFGQMSPNVVIQVGSGSGGTNGSTFVSQSVPTSMTAGQSFSVTVTMKNTGTTTWTTGSYKLGSQNPQDNNTWGLNRVSLSSSVLPNADATFTFNVTAPSTAGTYNFQWRMIQEGTGFFGATSTNVAVQVALGGGGGSVKLDGTPFGTSPAFASGREFDKAHDGNTSTLFDFLQANGGYTGIDLGAGNAKRVVKIRYFARSDWPGGPGRMVGGKFQGSNSSSSSGYVDLHTVTVAPPISGWVEVAIGDATEYRFLRYLGPNDSYCNVAEIEFHGPTGSGGGGTDDAAFVSQSVASNMTAGQTTSVSVTMRNTGTSTWTPTGGYKLGSQNPQDNTTWGMNRVSLPNSVGPGGEVTFSFSVTPPSTAGSYNFQWRVIKESTGFFGATSTNVAVQVTASGLTKLTGAAFGSSPAFASGREFDKAHDGNTSTFFDFLFANGGNTGIDLGAGNGRNVVKIRYFARSDWPGGPGRMVGGKFQGSNSSSSSGYVDLHTVTVAPPISGWVEVTISDANAYRYLRYLSPDGAYGNIADVEFYTGTPATGKLSGTAFGTTPAFASGREFDKAHDGNTSTFFDFLQANGGYTGIDLGAGNAKRVIKIRYYARSDWPGGPDRMIGGKFQGSNSSSSSGYVDLHTVTVAPPLGGWVEVTITDATEYRFLRYIAPNGAYCNIAEVEFYNQ